MQVKIRKATPHDFDEIEALDMVCCPEDERVDTSEKNTHWWIGRNEDDLPVCYAGAKVWRGPGREQVLLLTRAGVLPQARGQKLQARLIRAREVFAKRTGLIEVWTYTAHYNVASSNSLIRRGFKLWHPASWGGTSKVMVPVDGTAWLYWRKAIRPAQAL